LALSNYFVKKTVMPMLDLSPAEVAAKMLPNLDNVKIDELPSRGATRRLQRGMGGPRSRAGWDLPIRKSPRKEVVQWI